MSPFIISEKKMSLLKRIKAVTVDYTKLPEHILTIVNENYGWRIHNDTALFFTYLLPTYEELCDWDNILKQRCIEFDCSIEEYYADNILEYIISELFKMEPNEFKDYDSFVIRISW